MSVGFGSAFAIGSALAEDVWDLALDRDGNTAIVGSFRGTVDFDPGPGTHELTSTSSEPVGDLFVAKYNPSGSLLWARRMGGTPSDPERFPPVARFAVKSPEIVAANDNSLYVVGTFRGTADFGATTLVSQGSSDPFVARLDSNGNFLWAKQLDGSSGFGVAVDGAGNAFIAGEDTEGGNAIVTKLQANGAVEWTYVAGSSSSGGGGTASAFAVSAFKVAVDQAGDVYAVGRFTDAVGGYTTVDFDPGPGRKELSGFPGRFIVKLTSDGNFVWASLLQAHPHDIAVDVTGSVYVTGRVDASNATVLKLEANGAKVWQVFALDDTPLLADALALDARGGVYVSGSFSSPANFGTHGGTFTLRTAGREDVFLWKLDANGNLVWAVAQGGSGLDVGRGIAVDAVGNVYTTGVFSGTADFDPGARSTFNLTSTGPRDIVLSKLVQSSPPGVVWNLDSNGNWSQAGNWRGSVPNAAGAQATFGGVITQPRTVSVDMPITVGQLDFDNANAYTISGTNPITLDATSGLAQIDVVSGSHTIIAPVTLFDHTVMTISPAASSLSIAGALNGPKNLTKAGAGTLKVNSIRTAGLSINSGTVAVAPNGTADSTSVLRTLSIAGGARPTAKFDLNDNAAIINYTRPSPLATIRSQLLAGRGGPGMGGAWTGQGITSSAAAAANAAQPESRAIGYAENGTLPLGPYTEFRGQRLDNTSVLLAYTLPGDANLDGVVDDDDVTIVSAMYAPGVPQAFWALGDFDYNGFVDDDDITLLSANYGRRVGGM